MRMPDGGEPIGPGTKKACALLAYLAMHPGEKIRREALGALLWTTSGERQAANSLNQAVYSLRKLFQDATIQPVRGDNDCVWVEPGILATDVGEFESLAAAGDRDSLEQAWSLYRGPLLEGYDFSGAAFGDWLGAERTRLENRAIDTAKALLEQRGDETEPSSHDLANALLALDPYDEDAHRHVMRHLAASGRLPSALKHYDAMEALLGNDLDVAPSSATRALRDRLRSGAGQEVSTQAGETTPVEQKTGLSVRKPAIGLLIVLIAVLVAIGLWFLPRDPAPPYFADKDDRRLIVLPFEEAGDGAFGAAIADDISTELAVLPDLAVMARETARSLGGNAGLKARNLGASHILRGRVRRDDAGVTVNCWLVDVQSGDQIWAERYSGTPDAILDFREAIIRDVVAALESELGRDADDGLPPVGTGDADAYKSYLAGLVSANRQTPEGNAAALAHFKKAVTFDPDYIRAKVGMAKVYYDAAFGNQDYADAIGVNWMEGWLRMKAILAEGAVSSSAGGLVLLSDLALRRRDNAAAQDLARRSIKLEPSNAQAVEMLAEALIYAGETAEGRVYAQRALQLNPARPARATFLLGLADFADGRIAQAIDLVGEARASAAHPDAYYDGLLAAMYGETGDIEQGGVHLENYVEALEDRPRNEWKILARAFSNPRQTTWLRPTLTESVYAFPFSDDGVLDRLADGFKAVGIAGGTIVHLPAADRYRLNAAQIEDLTFGKTITGEGIPAFAGAWSQIRKDDGALSQSGPVGPMLLQEQGRSDLVRDGLCDYWQYEGDGIESCASVFTMRADEYLLATEFAPFLFSSGASE
ncbi:BTAD domain-containing putative transcriptional regulator [Flavimaribacter sediminis]|nr:BTAD domain-containing putative transcriptional regulator [Flavimaribacter sediminis]